MVKFLLVDKMIWIQWFKHLANKQFSLLLTYPIHWICCSPWVARIKIALSASWLTMEPDKPLGDLLGNCFLVLTFYLQQLASCLYYKFLCS